MRLATWTVHPVLLPYRRKVDWVDESEAGAPLLIVRLVSEEGASGVAEVTVKSTWSGASFRSMTAALEDVLMPRLAGVDLLDEQATVDCFATVPENQLARALVDNALWDLREAWHENGSVATGDHQDVEVSWIVTRQTPAMMAAEAAEMVEAFGFRTLKVKGGQGVETDLAAIREIRAAVGDGVRLYVDANWSYQAEETPSYLAALAAEGIVAVEDPYRLAPDRRFEGIQRDSPVPVVVDYFCGSVQDAALFTERGARSLSVKPGRTGLSPCVAQAEIAAERGCAVHVGSYGESELGSLAALRLAARLPDRGRWLPAESTFFLMMKGRLLEQPLEIRDGAIPVRLRGGVAHLVDWHSVGRLAA